MVYSCQRVLRQQHRLSEKLQNIDIKTSRKDQFFILMSLCQDVHTADIKHTCTGVSSLCGHVYVVNCHHFGSVNHKAWFTLAHTSNITTTSRTA